MSYYDYDSDCYNYKEICEKALAFNATQEDINALGEWFSRHGMSYWNGECFHVDADHNLYPIHKEIGYDEYEFFPAGTSALFRYRSPHRKHGQRGRPRRRRSAGRSSRNTRQRKGKKRSSS